MRGGLAAEAGTLTAKSAVEGHPVVRLPWSPGQSDGPPETAARS